MRSRWHLALCASALTFALVGGAEQALAAKSLSECPIYQAITAQRRQSNASRSAARYRNTRSKSLSTAGHITNGIKNIMIAPLEIPLTMRRVILERNLFVGLVGGGIEGMGNGLERLLNGAAETMAAPLPGVTPPTYRRRLGAAPGDSDTIASDILANIIDQR